MSENEPTPWRDQLEEKLDSQERIIRSYLLRLRPPAGLSADGVDKIARRLVELSEEPQKRYRRPIWRWSMAAAMVAMLAVSMFWLRSQPSETWVGRAGQARNLASDERLEALAPSEIHWQHQNRWLTIVAGKILLYSGEQPLNVHAGRANVFIRPRSKIAIVVRGFHSEIAAFEGSADVNVDGAAKLVHVAADYGWSSEDAGHAFRRQKRVISTEAPPIPSVPPMAPRSQPKHELSQVVLAPARPEKAIQSSHVPPPVVSDLQTRPVSPAGSGFRESQLIQKALAALDSHHPQESLSLLQVWQGEFSAGDLACEAFRIRVLAKVELHQETEALIQLKAASDLPADLRLLRAELAESHYQGELALEDYTFVYEQGPRSLRERALYGTIVSLIQLGRMADAKEQLSCYQAQFPNGRFVESLHGLLPDPTFP